MTDDIASNQPWNSFADTPETRGAVEKVQEHYLPIVKELRQDIETKNAEIEGLNKTIMMQRLFLVCIGLFSAYLAVFR